MVLPSRKEIMRIVCCECKAFLGEKCPKCGSKDAVIQRWTEVEAAGGFQVSVLKEYFCIGCAHAFPPGEGGQTDTYCEPCKEQFLAESRKAKTQAARP